ncbi:GUCD1-like protein [Tanacetum coccineum]
MWPLHTLLNKLLIGEDDSHEKVDNINLIESYNFKLPLRTGNGKKDGLKVPHIKQERKWDCSLACVLMVLRTLNINHYNIEDLEAFCPTTRGPVRLNNRVYFVPSIWAVGDVTDRMNLTPVALIKPINV